MDYKNIRVEDGIVQYEIVGEWRAVQILKQRTVYNGDTILTTDNIRSIVLPGDDVSMYDEYTRNLVKAAQPKELVEKYKKHEEEREKALLERLK